VLASLLVTWLNRAIVEQVEYENIHNSEREYPSSSTEPMTVGRIAAYVEKTYDWVRPRLRQYEQFIEKLPDSRNHLRPHYPGWVIDILKEEADEIADHLVVTDSDISKHGISRVIMRDERWIDARLPFLGIESTIKRNPVNNRFFEYFDKQDISLLQEESDRMRSYPVATEDESTIDGLAKILKVDRKTIIFRLQRLPIIPIVKMSPQINQLYGYYPTEYTLEMLREAEEYMRSPKGKHPSLIQREEEIVDQPIPSPAIPINHELEVNSENWMSYADCAQTDPDLFNDFQNTSKIKLAKKVCETCIAKLYCLDYAIVNDEREGIWGGLTYPERKKLKIIPS
jgi:WhiB family transcriptional regulator, redox-sensing transcriptional regulator